MAMRLGPDERPLTLYERLEATRQPGSKPSSEMLDERAFLVADAIQRNMLVRRSFTGDAMLYNTVRDTANEVLRLHRMHPYSDEEAYETLRDRVLGASLLLHPLLPETGWAFPEPAGLLGGYRALLLDRQWGGRARAYLVRASGLDRQVRAEALQERISWLLEDPQVRLRQPTTEVRPLFRDEQEIRTLF